MPKHTPGEWQVDPYRDNGSPSLHISAVFAGQRRDVARAIGWAGDGEDQAGYNAFLISAGPNLLAVAEKWMQHAKMNPSAYRGKSGKWVPLVEETRAAIKKAKGD